MILAYFSPSSKPPMLHIRFPKPKGEATNLGDWLAFSLAVPFVRNALSTFLNQSPVHPPKSNRNVTLSIHVCMLSMCQPLCTSLGDVFAVFDWSFCGFLLCASTAILSYLHISTYHLWELFTRFSLWWRPWASRTKKSYLTDFCIPGYSMTQCFAIVYAYKISPSLSFTFVIFYLLIWLDSQPFCPY